MAARTGGCRGHADRAVLRRHRHAGLGERGAGTGAGGGVQLPADCRRLHAVVQRQSAAAVRCLFHPVGPDRDPQPRHARDAVLRLPGEPLRLRPARPDLASAGARRGRLVLVLWRRLVRLPAVGDAVDRAVRGRQAAWGGRAAGGLDRRLRHRLSAGAWRLVHRARPGPAGAPAACGGSQRCRGRRRGRAAVRGEAAVRDGDAGCGVAAVRLRPARRLRGPPHRTDCRARRDAGGRGAGRPPERRRAGRAGAADRGTVARGRAALHGGGTIRPRAGGNAAPADGLFPLAA